jgi:CHAT domain-containing protein
LWLASAWLITAAAGTGGAAPISVQDNFRIGSGANVLCTAQSRATDPVLSDMFDRGYAIVCRDAAVPVGRLYALRLRGRDPLARLGAARADKVECGSAARAEVEELGPVELLSCRLKDAAIGYRVYLWRSRSTLYVAEGLAGYDSALRLGLRTVIADKPVPGELTIATTDAGDPAAFARVQAGTLDAANARIEAYRRNNKGSYAEAAEFFATLSPREHSGTDRAEALANDAVQQSNLGAFGEAEPLFAQAQALGGGDPVVSRMLRNYRAIHLLNQQQPDAALAELDKPLPASAQIPPPPPLPEIDPRTSARLTAEDPEVQRLASAASVLLPEERAAILDGQAAHIRGTILRLKGRDAEALSALDSALARLQAVRNGRVVSTMWMRAQIHSELAAIAETGGNAGEAEAQHKQAVALLEVNYPASSALLSAQARLAGFYARTGRSEPALALFRQVVDAGAERGDSSLALRRALQPYFALLAKDGAGPSAAADMFKASQILVRPGVAQTQAVMARELSGGSDEASRLFRQSVNLTRDIERSRIEIARLSAAPQPTAQDQASLEAARARLAAFEADQVATQSKLAEFPRYRAISTSAMTLADLQRALRDGEAYYKLTIIGDDAFAIFATPSTASAFRLVAGPGDLDREVDAIRATISVEQEGKILTYPFDVERAFRLFEQLFAPVADALTPVRHLIFEPDGALLRLPPNLLVTERHGVDLYLAKARRPNDDGFDFTDIKWLGRDRDVSTSVSASAFRDVRQVAPSRAPKGFLGFGENSPPPAPLVAQAAVQGLLDSRASCTWPLTAWNRPISAAELLTASSIIRSEGQATDIVTGANFSDSAIKAREDLAQYRILHFATHGFVTAPRPECPARPALLTSFGGGDSDGLLSFSEIYDLKLDADLIILSACDTAGKASLAATREAGVTTGGGYALDGLVRAFVGAGGRSVIASHWPVPDDYDATKKLIAGLFQAPPGTRIGTAMRRAQTNLMTRPETSHPYYWSGFAIVGDGASPLLGSR